MDTTSVESNLLLLLEVELFELRCSVVQYKSGSEGDYFYSASALALNTTSPFLQNCQ